MLSKLVSESAKSLDPWYTDGSANMESPNLRPPIRKSHRDRHLIQLGGMGGHIIKQSSTDETKLVPNRDWHSPQKAWRHRLRFTEINKVTD